MYCLEVLILLGCCIAIFHQVDSSCYICDMDTPCDEHEPLQLCPLHLGGACMIEAYKTESGGHHVVKRCLSKCPVFVNTTAEHIRCCNNVDDCRDINDIGNKPDPALRPRQPKQQDTIVPMMKPTDNAMQVPNGMRPKLGEMERRPNLSNPPPVEKADDRKIPESGVNKKDDVTEVTLLDKSTKVINQRTKPRNTKDIGKVNGKPKRVAPASKSRSHLFSNSASQHIQSWLSLTLLCILCLL